ncbi:DNRLRE domain-containing protein [Streptomyces sp. NPDC059743]|uniref:DNRLRE domain-containing protein n=1 Tax=Streptomyces sp. NPDC059743 TaxID=3346928 RepID=UPI0036527CB1
MVLWFKGGPPGPFAPLHPSARRQMRRVAGVVSLVLAMETALVTASTGQLAAATAESPLAASSTTAEGQAEAQDEASALLMARLQGRKIEVLSARTEDSTTWALPSGELQTAAYAGPIRVKQDGVWKDIDVSLSDTGSNLTPEATAADIAVSDGGDTSLASVTKGTKSFGLGWEDELPTPTVKDNTASYDLGGGQRLKVTALAQGFTENMVLDQQPDGPVSYRIRMDLDGLKLSQAESGHLLLKDSSGKLVAEASAPMMWDSTKNETSGEPEHQAKVATKVETDGDGKQTLVLTPAADFLATATYPVTVDPTSTLAVTTDTWVQTPDYTDSQQGSQELKSGTYDSGSHIARSYLKFDVSKFKGKHITDTNLALYSYYSSSCSPGAGTRARRITADWSSSDVTWGTQPTTTSVGEVINTGAWGYSSSCPANWSNWDIDGIVQAWADGLPNYGLRINSAGESDSLTWRRFRSANYTTSGYAPKLTATYNSYATTSSAAIAPSVVNAYNGTRYVRSLTPTLTAKVTDPDGATVKSQFEVTADPAYADTAYTYIGTSASVVSGATATLAIPSASAFPAGVHLRYRVRGHDNIDYGSWSGYTAFVLNTSLPATPSVTCDTYGQDTWTAAAVGPVTCTLDTTSTDGQGFNWGLDDPTTPKRVDDTADGTGGDPLTVSISPTDGWHTLYARTVDSGGNLSTGTTSYSFGVGDGAAVVAPKDGITTARRVTLQARGLATYTKATWYYRLGEEGDWAQIPADDVAATDGSGVIWPVPMAGGQSAALTWNVAATVGVDSDLQVRVSLSGDSASGYSPAATITLDRAAGQGPTKDIGPGTVNLLTGNYKITETDVDLLGQQVMRTAASRASSDDENASEIFGPGWIAGHGADVQDAGYAKVVKQSSTAVELVGFDGETSARFTASGATWTSADVEGLTLTGSTGGNTFTLADGYGTISSYALSSTPGTWVLDTVAHLSDDSEVAVSQAVFNGDAVSARPKYVITSTKNGAADDCYRDMSTADCRIIEYVYATSTTATQSDYSDFAGQVSKILLHAADPGTTKTTKTSVAAYAYDTSGHLRQAWDPRISPQLKTSYGYDTVDRVTSYGPPGQRAWNFTYARAGDSDTAGDGMLTRASRAGIEGNPDTGTVSLVYDVPLSGGNAPYQMSGPEVARWGQQTVPVDATAVFPADSVPGGPIGTLLDSGDYTRAEIAYADAEGRELNTASPGGHIYTREYDGNGNIVHELTAANRELALGTAADATAELALLQIGEESTNVRAERLSTVSTYDANGLLLSETGPLHLIKIQHSLSGGANATDLPAGEQVAARKHTTYTYDQDRPSGAQAGGLPTTTTVGAQVSGYPNDGDITVTTTQYNWDTGSPVKETVDPTGLTLATTTAYTSDGRLSATTVPGDTVVTTSYWDGAGSGTCSGHPEWAGMVCGTVTSAVSDTDKSEAIAEQFTYDRWGSPAKVVRTSGSTDRTTSYTYDDAGRLVLTHVASNTGAAMPDRAVTYDPGNGMKSTVSANGRTVGYNYDQLGRLTGYSDGTGNTTTTDYDSSNRRTSVKNSAASTTTYAYSATSSGDAVVTMTDSGAGAFTFIYGAEGRLESQTLPDDSSLKVSYNELGLVTQRLYASSAGVPELLSGADYTIGEKTAHDTRTAGTTVNVDYTYDRAGRLTRTDENEADSTCTVRAYALDGAGNRTSVTTTTATCGDTSSATTKDTYAYNAQNQISGSGYTYDAFGDTTALADGTDLVHYADGSANQLTRGTDRETWTLDAEGRLATAAIETKVSGSWTAAEAVVNHYDDDTTTPSWSSNGTTTSRYLRDPDGNLVATVDSAVVTLQLMDVHGDTAVTLATVDGATTVHAYSDTGLTDSTLRYGWLGETALADRQLVGTLLIGGRFYSPALGRYLTPMEAQESEASRVNPYLFDTQDLVRG